MSRQEAISRSTDYFDSGRFKSELSTLVAMPTESQNPDRADVLPDYLTKEIAPRFEEMGFTWRILTHPAALAPFLYAERIESPDLPTVLGYGHGDVIRGLDAQWSKGLSPWTLTEIGDRWYGRGVVDNKGQHIINMAAMRAVFEARGSLGFNAKYLIEMGEEMGSPGLRELCAEHRDLLAADVLIASDGPRLGLTRPTLFLGSRGGVTFDLTINAREGGHHSGNWGGLLSDPAIQLAHAISSIASARGQILLKEWVPTEIPDSVRRALADCEVVSGANGPAIDEEWGEPGLTLAEKVYGWCSFDVLAMKSGTPESPVNAVPPSAWARCQLRYVVGVDPEGVLPALRAHLDEKGLHMVEVAKARENFFIATRTDPDDPWVDWAVGSMTETTGGKPAILPNFGGSLPNDVFADILGMRTLWVPHSYPGCSQHAPDEHLPVAIAREGLAIMAGLYWDLGERAPAV
ncbi:M20 family metallopeptidase [Acuticoccus kandeliae]|uniref:M20 family metallopeptidase n=1 Tax=Acuticoccus kandeliae TaxID=2073160 RepID=UPI000D3EB376|nr:M20 family metallopeptidase [Acuticoccus kandeliae]